MRGLEPEFGTEGSLTKQSSRVGAYRLNGAFNERVLVRSVGVGGSVSGASFFNALVKLVGEARVGVVVLRAVVSDDFLDWPAEGLEEADQLGRCGGVSFLLHIGDANDQDQSGELIDANGCSRCALKGERGRFEGVEDDSLSRARSSGSRAAADLVDIGTARSRTCAVRAV